MSEGGYIIGKTRVGDNDPSPPVVGGSPYPDLSQVRFLSSDTGAPTTPALPIDPPTPPTRLGVAAALRGSDALLIWNLVPPGAPAPPGFAHTPWGTDFAWRWQQHAATPSPALGSSPYMSVDTNGLSISQQAIPSGGGSYTGFPRPGLFLANTGPLVDPTNTPIWTLAVEWESEVVTVDGLPPTTFSSSLTPPPLPRLTNQPIVGNSYTNSPWLLYCAYSCSWIGGPGFWVLGISSRLMLAVGGSGGPTTTVAINDKRGGVDYIEFNNTAHTILLYGATSSGVPASGGSHGDPISTGVSGPGGWPGDFNGYAQEFGAGNMGAYYWASWRQLNGYLKSVAVTQLSAVDTVTLVSERSLVPGTGPIAPNVKFRAGTNPSKGLSSQLSEYTYYWPLDDPSPGPMYDLLAGAYLTVVNPSLATFQEDGITNPLAPTHTKAIRLGRAARSYSYLTWNNRGPRPSLGTGAAGHDLTIGCWIRWEGPVGGGNERLILQSSYVPFGFASEPALAVTIWPFVEPFGVKFTTWSVGSHFQTLKTTGFDWPAEYLLFSGSGSTLYDDPVPYKGPTWAYLTVVMRTVSGHKHMEIWVDGVLLASQLGADDGWGRDVSLLYVGNGITPVTLQHLTIWPFALDPDAIAGVGA